jgi:serine/threonine protein kinase
LGQPIIEPKEAVGRLGKYDLIRSLAVGGMAEVFLARASGIEGFEKLVVVKRILPQLAVNEDFVRMFLDEARLAAQLHHPNIAQVYDVGRDGAAYYMVLEYINGHDLREVIRASARSGGMPLEHALTIVSGVASGLHHAHEFAGADGRPLGIVHRDVSATNILVAFTGAVKLVDFGVAKARIRKVETREGTLIGKLAYMSPEQCRAEPLDRRSDIFSLGLILYELTTGRRPYDEEVEYKLMNLVAEGQVAPPSSVARGYPRDLEAIVMKALEPAPDDRYATAEELQVDLERFAAQGRLGPSTVSLRRYMRAIFDERRPRPPTEPQGERPRTVVLEADAPDDDSLSMPPVSGAILEPPPALAPARPGVRRRLVAALAGLLLAGGVAVTISALRRGPPPPAPEPPPAPAAAAPPPAAPPGPPLPVAPPAAAIVAPAPAVAAPDAGPAEAPPPRKMTKKRRHRWDPDSPFLPPERR